MYLSKKSILSASGHPYNGGTYDWDGINEVLLIQNCKNFCSPLRANWELEYKYAETIKNAATFMWANGGTMGKGWGNDNILSADANIPITGISTVSWNNNSNGGIVKYSSNFK